MATIRENVELVLKHLGIEGVKIVDELPDRVNALDTLGQLRKHIAEHPEHWLHDAWDPLHGHISASYRERARPSMQVCLHPISQINPNHPPETEYDEIDVDFAPPDTPLDFLRHTKEVLDNAITRRKTDQNEVAVLLAARFATDEETTA